MVKTNWCKFGIDYDQLPAKDGILLSLEIFIAVSK